MAATFPARLQIERSALEDLLKRRFFYAPSFSIYGGFAGLYDFGPPGTAMKANLIHFWRKFFVYEESMQEIDTVCLTPEPVLQASGHVAKFADFMVRDVVTGKCYRADHLLEDEMEKLLEQENITPAQREEYEVIKASADALSQEELGEKLRKYNVKSPEGENDISDPLPFNLMFDTSIGPTGNVKGYLRPETAQGIFVNFQRLLEQNGGKIPFAVAQIGRAFRNEIAPRSGLLRVREFILAEIEHFVKEKDHPKFESVANLELQLFPRKQQNTDQTIYTSTIGNAVAKGIVDNETIGYYIGRVYLFLKSVGIAHEKLRFRQHLEKEMAHYAKDCWDAEILTTYGWIECVGIADRSCFDLTQHTNATNSRLFVYETFPEPKIVDTVVAKPNKGLIGKTYKKEAQVILKHLASLDSATAEQYSNCQASHPENQLEINLGNTKYALTKDMVAFEKKQQKVSGQNIIPSVVEPSFGIGRILYALLEQSFYIREHSESDKITQGVLSLHPLIAPVKCCVLPLMSQEKFSPLVQQIASELSRWGLPNKIDDSSATIGRRYARSDEVGTPFAVTVDHTSLEDNTVTLRERDSAVQIRIPVIEVARQLLEICEGRLKWSALLEKYPKVQ